MDIHIDIRIHTRVRCRYTREAGPAASIQLSAAVLHNPRGETERKMTPAAQKAIARLKRRPHAYRAGQPVKLLCYTRDVCGKKRAEQSSLGRFFSLNRAIGRRRCAHAKADAGAILLFDFLFIIPANQSLMSCTRTIGLPRTCAEVRDEVPPL